MGFIFIPAVFFVLFGLIAVVVIRSANKDGAQANESTKFINSFAEKNNFQNCKIYKSTINNHTYRFMVDEASQRCAILCDGQSGTQEIIPFSQIIGCETLADNVVETRTTGGIGRAMVGSVLAGGVGAVVGASTAKTVATEKAKNYKLVIYKNDVSSPKTEVTLITETTPDYYLPPAREFAANVSASIKAIIANNEKKEQSKQAQPSEELISKLQKLKSAYESGVLTEQEYQEKRKALIDKL